MSVLHYRIGELETMCGSARELLVEARDSLPPDAVVVRLINVWLRNATDIPTTHFFEREPEPTGPLTPPEEFIK